MKIPVTTLELTAKNISIALALTVEGQKVFADNNVNHEYNKINI